MSPKQKFNVKNPLEKIILYLFHPRRKKLRHLYPPRKFFRLFYIYDNFFYIFVYFKSCFVQLKKIFHLLRYVILKIPLMSPKKKNNMGNPINISKFYPILQKIKTSPFRN